MTPSARSTRHLRELGYFVANVERRIPRIGITVDAYGWGDLLAVHPLHGIALVQVTSGSNLSARIKKAQGLGALVAWTTAGGKLLAHGWAKRGARGERKTWRVREVEIRLEDLVRKEATA